MRRDLPRAKGISERPQSVGRTWLFHPSGAQLARSLEQVRLFVCIFRGESSFALELNNVGEKYAIYYERIVLRLMSF